MIVLVNPLEQWGCAMIPHVMVFIFGVKIDYLKKVLYIC